MKPKLINCVLTVKALYEDFAKADVKDLSCAEASELIKRIIQKDDERRKSNISAS